MKNILVMFLLGTMTIFSQSTTVRGVTLSYDKVKKIMTLKILPKTMYTNDASMDVNVSIYRDFGIKMIMNGVSHSISKPYFEHVGHTRDMGWFFITHKPSRCKEVKENYIYTFSEIQSDEEYILIVSNVCDDKYVTDEQTGSIIIK